ncbi:hypothetical protein OCHUTO_0836 [Orientia chuto str. Dubai]|uniref:Uncharacterized protein n=1 Tax=Orientia chuto str. Dubai TaxID=1359168 RepID=A0A0F3MIY1_9RICK|nr:hypothetical protein [Candidatus Orientia mediorientalis]KJV55442.1 hypothetical protein OCHUTO_0836 [Orientia chuto str. Dubai]
MFKLARKLFSRETHNCVSKAAYAFQDAKLLAHGVINDYNNLKNAMHDASKTDNTENHDTCSVSNFAKSVSQFAVPIGIQYVTANPNIAAAGGILFNLYNKDEGKALGQAFSDGVNCAYGGIKLSAAITKLGLFGCKAAVNAAIDYVYEQEPLDAEINKWKNCVENFTMHKVEDDNSSLNSFVSIERKENANETIAENDFSMLIDAAEIVNYNSLERDASSILLDTNNNVHLAGEDSIYCTALQA